MRVLSEVKGGVGSGGLLGVMSREDSGPRDVETTINAPYCLSNSICLCTPSCKPI